MKAVLVAVMLVSAVACSSEPANTASPSPSATPSSPLLTVTMRGGLCSGGTCETTNYVDHDGRVHLAAKPPNDLGYIGEQELVTLQEAIATANFDEIRSHPFTGTCPTAFDGQELVLEFNAPSGTQTIASCEVAIDWSSPLFAAVTQAIAPLLGEFHQP